MRFALVAFAPLIAACELVSGVGDLRATPAVRDAGNGGSGGAEASGVSTDARSEPGTGGASGATSALGGGGAAIGGGGTAGGGSGALGSGGLAAADAGGVETPCLPGRTDCNGGGDAGYGHVPRTCRGDSKWHDGPFCIGTCAAGRCTPATCSNTSKDGNETDIDCGGSCSPCAVGRTCTLDTDCALTMSGKCSGAKCAAAACNDGVMNGDESYTDCGGSCGTTCIVGQGCTSNNDCAASACIAGLCAGTCSPGSKRCTAGGSQTCSSSGVWGPVTPCSCTGLGVCTGCPAGLGDCDFSLTTNGCETVLGTSSMCGTTCANAVSCSATQICAANACKATPSCVGLAAGCGPSGESCCATALVAGDDFYRSYDGATFPDKSAPATVSDFRLDTYEVTVGRFRKFVAAWVAGYRPNAGDGKHAHLHSGNGLSNTGAGGYEPGWNTTWASNLASTMAGWDANLACSGSLFSTWTGGDDNRPVNCGTWYELNAFCIWDGGFLPSEAEWNYAASGGKAQRVYPWGATEPDADANLAIYGCYFNGSGACVASTSQIAPVGSVSAGRGRYGQMDLAGNMTEWTLDALSGAYEPACENCTYLPATIQYRVTRGGSFDASALLLHTASRLYGTPTYRDPAYGVRCARTP
ncbi:MAG TPA: SUMF1/EgtB/PvdO family nonheme iron enzyme [Polyangiaceae bacterium]